MTDKNIFLIPLVIVSLLLVSSIGFASWAFMGRQDYKNNVDAKIDDAVKVAEDNLSIKKDAQFAEDYKKPNVTYKGPSAFGTLTITYPKTWSNYVRQQPGGTLLDGFMHPSYVSADADATNFALRYQVIQGQYDQELKKFESMVKTAKVKTSAYKSPKQESARAIRIEGEVQNKKQGVLILIELRDKTIKIWTEGDEFRPDFERVLEELSFVP